MLARKLRLSVPEKSALSFSACQGYIPRGKSARTPSKGTGERPLSVKAEDLGHKQAVLSTRLTFLLSQGLGREGRLGHIYSTKEQVENTGQKPYILQEWFSDCGPRPLAGHKSDILLLRCITNS